MPSKPGSTLPKLGTCFVAGKMPGGKPCWFKAPSLERVLLLVLEGFQPWNMPQHQIALRLSWGPSGDGLFSRRVLASRLGPQLIGSAACTVGVSGHSPQARTTRLHIL